MQRDKYPKKPERYWRVYEFGPEAKSEIGKPSRRPMMSNNESQLANAYEGQDIRENT